MRSLLIVVLLALGSYPAGAQHPLSISGSPLEPAGTGGLQSIDRALEKLSSHRRLLVVGAHPDDEDTTLLALVGSGLGGEAAYLSLSRGEGGQNLIGPELGVGLGLIRTGELLAARRIEGTRQYFTRAYDFGYTRSLAETFERWPRAVLLEDAVRVVRTFKPQVVVAVFPADSRAGHGQHQAAGVIAEEVFARAGFPDRYPELTDWGLPPWQPSLLFRRVWRDREEATFRFDLDQIEPFSGHSVLQIAGASRSQHRSQDMGTLQPLGGFQGGVIHLAGAMDPGTEEIFSGIDTRLSAIANLLPEGPARAEVQLGLERVMELALTARSVLTPARPAAVVPALAEICSILDVVFRRVLEVGGSDASLGVRDLLSEKRQTAGAALAAAAGVAVDALADRQTVAIGQSFRVTATVWNSGSEEVAVEEVELGSRPHWVHTRLGELEPESGLTGLRQWGFEIEVPDDSSPTVPYFLAVSRVGDVYDWSRSDEGFDHGLPLEAPAVRATFRLTVAGVPVTLIREVVHRQRDQALGEVRQPIRAVPRVEVEARPSLIVWPRGAAEFREVEVLVRSNSEQPLTGEVELRSVSGHGGTVSPVTFRIEEPGGQRALRIALPAPTAAGAARTGWTVRARLDDGRVYERAYPVIRHPHIRPMTLPSVARIDVQSLDLELPKMSRVGYIRGAADRVPEILLEIGLPLEILAEAELRTADLGAYDAIVVGSRAYETDPVLAEVNPRLLEYLQGGGRLLVQYQQYQFVRGGFAPLSLEIDRPHGRVTDETAPVTVLAPEHPVFRTPNDLSAADWEGWVQERGLYFASRWDPALTPLVSLHDEGQAAQEGALLVAKIGRGTYIYTGLSFFRQLPAGVPGAIRLFVNLLSPERS